MSQTTKIAPTGIQWAGLVEPAADERGDHEARQRQDEQQRGERLQAHWRIASYSSTRGVLLLR